MNRLRILFLLLSCTLGAQTSNVAPILQATGNQAYCPGTALPIATSMSFIDPDDTGTQQVTVQISGGYVVGQDILMLTGVHPNISSSWDAAAGKLTLTGITSQPTYAELQAAILGVVYQSNHPAPTGTRTFAIAVGDANYLPSTGHYYLFVPNVGITWSDALTLAAASNYFGLQGYLATLTSAEEATFAGNQASGTGWIGASDQQTEGQWRWMSGPEMGTLLTYSFWNSGEPNNMGNEDYAHITAPGVGIPGSWNDLSNTGESSGPYQPQGYIVEFGGMPNDPILQLSTSTSVYMVQINSITEGESCGPGSVTLSVTASGNPIAWYTSAVGGTPIASGPSFTTPILSSTTVYFAALVDCPNTPRTPLVALIRDVPVVTVGPTTTACAGNTQLLSATTTAGILRWYDDPTTSVALASGTTFTTPPLTAAAMYYVEADNNGCRSGRIPIVLPLFPSPDLGNDEVLAWCENQSGTLSVSFPNGTYLWSNGSTTNTITVSQAGTYTVTVTTPEGCTDSKTFTVNTYAIPQIASVLVNGLDVSLFTVNPGDYEYSIDGLNFQDTPFFTLPTGGNYVATVREVHGCGLVIYPFNATFFSAFFTPNGDGINDQWTPKGLVWNAQTSIVIFDRFGRILKVLDANTPGWDGLFMGQLAPADDYWFRFQADESAAPQLGHFSLKR